MGEREKVNKFGGFLLQLWDSPALVCVAALPPVVLIAGVPEQLRDQ